MRFRLEDLIEDMHDGLYFVDKARRITFWNKAAEKITGFTADEVVGRSCSDNILIHVDDQGNSLCLALCPLARAIKEEISLDSEIYLHHKDGHRVPVWVHVTPLKDTSGITVGGAELFTDMSSKEVSLLRIRELEKLALIDPLTKLSNRNHIESELNARFQEMQRYGLSFGVLFADVDHFKNVNDNYGHDVGDRVLQTVANTMMSSGRPFDIFGRWGGEEFVGIIRNVDHDTLRKVGERLRMLIERSRIHNNDETLSVTVSMGAAMAGAEDDAASLIKRADALMYESKKNGRNRITMEI
ncbi:MAG: sensor domain-containing diguanylate cyclase [Deltaproteobacteria bacterium]|nr:sensor domain-containing diguanylate cyclase [Deltaproteobacteria bacterium]